MMRLHVLTALIALAALAHAPGARAADPLSVCLEEGSPPYSYKYGKRMGGFDLSVARTVAERLGRPYRTMWYEAEEQPEKGEDTVSGIAALLADGRCRLVGGYALYEGSLGRLARPNSPLPDYRGRPREDRWRLVELKALKASRAYLYAPLVLVVGPKADGRTITRLADVADLRFGAEGTSLADTILMVYGGGRLVPRITHLPPGAKLFQRFEAGEFDAALVDLHGYEAYRTKVPATSLKPSGFEHWLGVNMGFVGLEADGRLIGDVNGALAEMRRDGTMDRLAVAAGITYSPPRAPEIRPTVSLADLMRE